MWFLQEGAGGALTPAELLSRIMEGVYSNNFTVTDEELVFVIDDGELVFHMFMNDDAGSWYFEHE